MIPELINCFDESLDFLHKLVADLTDEEMVHHPLGVPNHAAWTLGHITFVCQRIVGRIGVAPWLPDDWGTSFGNGSLPERVPAKYARNDDLLGALDDAGRRVRAALAGLDATALAVPYPDERLRKLLPTMGHGLVQIVGAHTAFHVGQLAVWRRAIGKAPVGGFV